MLILGQKGANLDQKGPEMVLEIIFFPKKVVKNGPNPLFLGSFYNTNIYVKIQNLA